MMPIESRRETFGNSLASSVLPDACMILRAGSNEGGIEVAIGYIEQVENRSKTEGCTSALHKQGETHRMAISQGSR